MEAGTKLGFEALEIVKRTDALMQHGEVLLDLAETLRLAARLDEASDCVDAALRLFAKKEDAASAGKARVLLSELAV